MEETIGIKIETEMGGERERETERQREKAEKKVTKGKMIERNG